MQFHHYAVNASHIRRRQSGISNIQLIVYILVGAILILGGIGLLSYIDKAKVNNDVQELTDLKASTVSYGAQRGGNFGGVTTDSLAGLNFFPTNRVSGSAGSRIVANQWKGNVTAAPATTISANDSVEFTYSGVPSTPCKSLVAQLADVASIISVNGTVVKPNGGTINEATMVQQCEQTTDNASIAYRLSR